MLTGSDLYHNHPPANFPLEEPRHRRRQPEQRLVEEHSRLFRQAHISHGNARRILATRGQDISKKEYYNLQRSASGRGTKKGDEMECRKEKTLVMALGAAGFHYRLKRKTLFDGHGRAGTQLTVAAVFTTSHLITLAKRFVSNWIMEIDVTFNTNNRRLLLLVATGVAVTGHTVPVAFAYIVSESTEAFEFFFECFDELVFNNGSSSPRVVLSDQAQGLIASFAGRQEATRQQELLFRQQAAQDRRQEAEVQHERRFFAQTAEEQIEIHAAAAEAMAAQAAAEKAKARAESLAEACQEGWEGSDATERQMATCLEAATVKKSQILQLCQWQVVENIKKRVRKARYSHDEVKVLDQNIWSWIQAPDSFTCKQRERSLLLPSACARRPTLRSTAFLKRISLSQDG